MRITRIVQLLVFWGVLGISLVWAQSPQLINYQGKLSDSDGNPINGTRNLTFAIYSAPTGGSPLWSETQSDTLNDGVFNTLLGSVTPIPPDLFKGNGDRYLGITVGAGTELSPRFHLTSVPYAFRTAYSDTASFVPIDTVNYAKQAATSDTAQYAFQAPAVDSVQHAVKADSAQYATTASHAGPVGDAGGDLTGVYPNPVIAPNAVNADKIADEPGVAWRDSIAYFTLANFLSTNQRVDSVSITTPGAGYVVVQATGFVILTHGTSADNITLIVSNDPGVYAFNPGSSSFLVPSSLPTAGYRFPFSCQSVFEVSSATTLKVYLIVNQYQGSNPTSTLVYAPYLIATYYPSNYGAPTSTFRATGSRTVPPTILTPTN